MFLFFVAQNIPNRYHQLLCLFCIALAKMRKCTFLFHLQRNFLTNNSCFSRFDYLIGLNLFRFGSVSFHLLYLFSVSFSSSSSSFSAPDWPKFLFCCLCHENGSILKRQRKSENFNVCSKQILKPLSLCSLSAWKFSHKIWLTRYENHNAFYQLKIFWELLGVTVLNYSKLSKDE